jgi:hypothetical protein
MTENNKPLPKPPNTAFGNKNRFKEEDDPSTLIADRMAEAMAGGKLDEFIQQEIPDNEYARSLAGMMMGMTGMLPMGGAPTTPPRAEQQPQSAGGAFAEQVLPTAEIPTEVLEDAKKAIEGGDVKSLMKLLQQEHSKRTPGSDPGATEELTATPPPNQPAIDKDQVDALLQIAKDNSVSVDWLIIRAIKVYVQEYQKTGKL